MKVTSVKYFETTKGVAFRCKTNIKDIEVCNDGNGGATYIDGNLNKLTREYTEWDLEDLIDDYEDNDYERRD